MYTNNNTTHKAKMKSIVVKVIYIDVTLKKWHCHSYLPNFVTEYKILSFFICCFIRETRE